LSDQGINRVGREDGWTPSDVIDVVAAAVMLICAADAVFVARWSEGDRREGWRERKIALTTERKGKRMLAMRMVKETRTMQA
jgi:hypothetical protein